jgi:hypothetical protein
MWSSDSRSSAKYMTDNVSMRYREFKLAEFVEALV